MEYSGDAFHTFMDLDSAIYLAVNGTVTSPPGFHPKYLKLCFLKTNKLLWVRNDMGVSEKQQHFHLGWSIPLRCDFTPGDSRRFAIIYNPYHPYIFLIRWQCEGWMFSHLSLIVVSVNKDWIELYLRAFTGNSATTLHGYNSLAHQCRSHLPSSGSLWLHINNPTLITFIKFFNCFKLPFNIQRACDMYCCTVEALP